MPEISRFYGIVIRMYYNDHAPPHFHANYAGREAVIDIQHLALITGNLPPRALGLVMEWAALHREQLMADWQHARAAEPLEPIEPLA